MASRNVYRLALAAWFVVGAGLAQAAAPDSGFDGNRGIEPQTQNGVTYVMGGVGLDESDAIKAMPGFNLHMTFARNDGAYQSNAKVALFDSKGQDLLDTTANGPLLYAKLPPGDYKVVVEADGKQLTRQADIGKGVTNLDFIW